MPGSRIYFGIAGGGADPNAEEIQTLNFAFNTTSPLLIFQPPAGSKILMVEIAIITAFNSPTAALFVGDLTVNDRLMAAVENFPNEVGTYQAHHAYTYVAATNLYLFISPSGATTGGGIVSVYHNLNN